MTSTTFPPISPALSADMDLLRRLKTRHHLLTHSRSRPLNWREIDKVTAEIKVLKVRIERAAMECDQ